MSTSHGRRSGDDDAEVLAVDDDGRYVIADISEDGAWLSIGAAEAPALDRWR